MNEPAQKKIRKIFSGVLFCSAKLAAACRILLHMFNFAARKKEQAS
jgi:hypothetical protein